jgi:hypothetical protein
MKPLVLWCRWHDAKLRLRGRNDASVWGEIAFPDRTEKFTFELDAWKLTLGEGEESRELQLDEMGVELDQA